MTELLLNSCEAFMGTFQKITPSIYFNTQKSSFHRLAFLPNTVIFQNQQISQPHFATFTSYDPYFFLINLLLRKITPVTEISPHFKHLNISLIADIKNEGGRDVYVLNKLKIYDFLEKKVQRLQKCLSDKFDGKRLQVDKSMIQEKMISEETVLILKSEIDDKLFVDGFAKQRFDYENIRKLMPYNEEVVEETFAKKKAPSKKVAKPEEKRLEQGQKSLFSFFGGKK